MYDEFLQLFSLLKPRPFLAIGCKHTFSWYASIQSTTMGNPFHLDVHHCIVTLILKTIFILHLCFWKNSSKEKNN